MGAPLLQLLGQVYIVLEGVFILFGVEDVTGVADGSLGHFACGGYFFQGQLHAGNPVEGVEHPEDVNAASCRLPDEFLDDVVRVVGVAHGVCAPNQHLERDVGDAAPQLIQPFPGGFVEEPVGHVEGSAAPHLQREGAV